MNLINILFFGKTGKFKAVLSRRYIEMLLEYCGKIVAAAKSQHIRYFGYGGIAFTQKLFCFFQAQNFNIFRKTFGAIFFKYVA